MKLHFYYKNVVSYFRFDRPFFWPAAALNPEPGTLNPEPGTNHE
jgi:hypothetical protein